MLIQPGGIDNKIVPVIAQEYYLRIIEIGNTIQGLTNIVVEKVFFNTDLNDYYNFNEFLIYGLLFGNTSRRDQR